MIFPNYTMKPLDMHIDGGFGAMADSFMKAAENLAQNKENVFSNAHLPINFLYRHAIELYLKSIIIVIHSSLNIPYGDKAKPHVMIISTGKWKPMTNIHYVSSLYEYFEYLVTQNKLEIAKVAETDWSDIPLELKNAIASVATVDDSSTYFRYPSISDPQSDNEKSAWKEVDHTEIIKSTKREKRPIKAFMEVDDNDDVVSTYRFNYDPLEQISEETKIAAKILESAHLGIRIELAGGR